MTGNPTSAGIRSLVDRKTGAARLLHELLRSCCNKQSDRGQLHCHHFALSFLYVNLDRTTRRICDQRKFTLRSIRRLYDQVCDQRKFTLRSIWRLYDQVCDQRKFTLRSIGRLYDQISDQGRQSHRSKENQSASFGKVCNPVGGGAWM
ncbi:hypothetical protein ACJMK2_001022 [Sinanodonta woodiana]|uniref:Uncharacterized protein n=1 Tax=Sinanodonta woodiana TaxID=1069815 RepID=A0ABD3XRH5_SINWO